MKYTAIALLLLTGCAQHKKISVLVRTDIDYKCIQKVSATAYTHCSIDYLTGKATCKNLALEFSPLCMNLVHVEKRVK